MSQRLVSDVTTVALERALDGAALEQRMVANNLANLETPGFVARHAQFHDSLRAALDAERGRASSTVRPVQPHGNNVDVETEMTALSESVLQYEVLTRLLSKKLSMVGVVIGDGKRG
jgi:flagellar basal-body rod protein FlgB